MTKSERLLEIIRILHERRYAVTAQELAVEFGISLRSVYRDIASLQKQGIPVDGEAGVGYLLRNGYTLPPLMFTVDELEALAIGAKWVLSTGDGAVEKAATDAIRKIRDAVPPSLRRSIDEAPLMVGYRNAPKIDRTLARAVHEAIRKNLKLHIAYQGGANDERERTVWPIALGYFESAVILAAWCELRGAFRHFRVDRIRTWRTTKEAYPVARTVLYRAWLDDQRIEDAENSQGDC